MLPILVVMIAVIGITLVGDYFLKLAAINRTAPTLPFLGGAAMYVLSAVAIVIAMRHMTLAAFGVWYSVLTILAMTALGVIVFEERLTPRDMLGIGLAIGALACMTRTA